MPHTIALVDDDRNILTSVSMTLEQEGFQVRTYTDGESALQGLLARGLVVQFAYAAGVVAAPRDAPRRNLTDDPYFTDGLRLVAVLSPDPVPPSEVVRLDWENEPGPIAGGQSERRRRPRTP